MFPPQSLCLYGTSIAPIYPHMILRPKALFIPNFTPMFQCMYAVCKSNSIAVQITYHFSRDKGPNLFFPCLIVKLTVKKHYT